MPRDACAVSEGGEMCVAHTVAVRGGPRGPRCAARGHHMSIARPPGRSRHVVCAALSRLLHRMHRRLAHTLQWTMGGKSSRGVARCGEGDLWVLFF